MEDSKLAVNVLSVEDNFAATGRGLKNMLRKWGGDVVERRRNVAQALNVKIMWKVGKINTKLKIGARHLKPMLNNISKVPRNPTCASSAILNSKWRKAPY